MGPIKLFFDTHLSNYKLKHISTALIETIFGRSANKNEKKVFLNINSCNFNVLILENGLKFFNTFDFQNEEDILYYTLFACEQSGVDVQSDMLELAGEFEAGSGVHKLMSQYVKNISFAVTEKGIARGEIFKKIPHHYYFNLLNRFVCG